MWDTPSLTQALQSCHSTQVILQKNKSTRGVLMPQDQNRASPGLCGAPCCDGGPILSWSQLLMSLQITVQPGSFWGRECRNPSYSVWGMCGRPGWRSLPDVPSQGAQQEKRTLEKLDFHPGHPGRGGLKGSGWEFTSPRPPRLTGYRRHSGVTPAASASNAELSPALTASQGPKTSHRTQPQETHGSKPGKRWETQKGERI